MHHGMLQLKKFSREIMTSFHQIMASVQVVGFPMQRLIYSRKRNLGGGGRQNLIWGIGEVDAKQFRVGYARGEVKKKSRRGGVVEVKKNTRKGCLMHSYSLGKCKGGGGVYATPEKGVGSSGEVGELT